MLYGIRCMFRRDYGRGLQIVRGGGCGACIDSEHDHKLLNNYSHVGPPADLIFNLYKQTLGYTCPLYRSSWFEFNKFLGSYTIGALSNLMYGICHEDIGPISLKWALTDIS